MASKALPELTVDQELLSEKHGAGLRPGSDGNQSAAAPIGYEFGPFRLLPAERMFLRDGAPVSLTDKTFDTLLVLVRRHGQLVDRSELIRTVWADSFVEEGNLTVVICTLRKVLGDENGKRDYIQTVARHGYRFIAEVRDIFPEAIANREALPREKAEVVVLPASSPFSELKLMSRSRGFRNAAAAVAILLLSLAAWTGYNRWRAGDQSQIRALAVLPFHVLNANSSSAYLSTGMADAIITRLGSTGEIVVRPTSAIQAYEHENYDPFAAGKEQKVDAILVGNIEVLNDAVTLRAQLVRVSDHALLWADTFHEPPQHMFMLEEEVAQRVAQLGLFHLSGTARNNLALNNTTNPKAYQLYLQGRYLLNERTKDSVENAVVSFEQAIANDPRDALAYAGIADAYVLLGTYGQPPWQLYPKAEQAVFRALELNPALADASVSQAMISFHYEWNWPKAESEFKRAISLNANDSMAHAQYAMFLAAMGRDREAQHEAELSSQLDPVSPLVGTVVARVDYFCHNYDQAVNDYKKVISLDPQFASAHTRLGMTYLAMRNYQGALSEFDIAQKMNQPDAYEMGMVAYAEAQSGNAKSARAILDKLLAQSQTQYVPALSIALVYTALGDRERAVEWLNRSYQDRSTHMIYAKVDPLFDPLRTETRFQSVLQQMGL